MAREFIILAGNGTCDDCGAENAGLYVVDWCGVFCSPICLERFDKKFDIWCETGLVEGAPL